MHHEPFLLPRAVDGASARFRVVSTTLIGLLLKDRRNEGLFQFWAEHTGLINLGIKVARYRLELDNGASPPPDWAAEEIERRLSDFTLVMGAAEALQDAIFAAYGIRRRWLTSELTFTYLLCLSWLVTGQGFSVIMPAPKPPIERITRGAASHVEFARQLREYAAAHERAAVPPKTTRRRPKRGVHLEKWVEWWYQHRVQDPATPIAALAAAHAGSEGDPENARRLIQRRIQDVEKLLHIRP